uniref:HGH1 homolog n=1 Tax=Equus caballus TaxID=9796 RepID=A0A9L0T677_HORSE
GGGRGAGQPQPRAGTVCCAHGGAGGRRAGGVRPGAAGARAVHSRLQRPCAPALPGASALQPQPASCSARLLAGPRQDTTSGCLGLRWTFFLTYYCPWLGLRTSLRRRWSYLPPDKQREPDPDIRKMLIEAIMLLTATAPGRQQVRDQGAYLILRELHTWEPEPDVRATCEKLIQVLIGDEPERGMENLLEVQVPEDVEEQLQQLDRQEQEQCVREQQERELSPEPQAEGAAPT